MNVTYTPLESTFNVADITGRFCLVSYSNK